MPPRRKPDPPVVKSRRIRRGDGGTADWATVDSELIRDAIAAAAGVSGALRFGYSRDGGAYAIGVYGDGEPYTEYFRPSDDISGVLREIEQLFLDIAVEQGPKANGS